MKEKQYLIKIWFFKKSTKTKNDLREEMINTFEPIFRDALENIEIEEV